MLFRSSLGLGDYDDRSTPTQVTELASRFVTQLTAGHLFSMALCSDGSVHTWGANGSGQLGLDDTTRRNAPAVVSAFNGMAVKQVVAGGSHGLALLMDGSVYTWGANHYGQLGHGDSGASAGRTSPTLVSALEGKGVVLLSAGHHSSFALCSDGSVYAWGSNEFGQLGLGDAEVGVNRNTPTLVTSLSDKGVADFGKGHKYSLALCSDGSVYSWGSGNGTPSLVSELSDRAATQVVCGYDFMLVLCDDGSVHAWGSNGMGVLGLGDTDARTAPTLVTALEGKGVIGISSWDGHCLAAGANGEAYSWGDNWFGKLGLGTDRDSDPIRTLPARGLLP